MVELLIVDEIILPSSMGPLLPSRVLLKSASTFTGVLQQFARTAASRESGGVKGAWAQLLDPLPQRKEAAGGDEKALGQVDPKWLEELQRRRSLDSASPKREVGSGSSSVEEMQESKFEAQPWVQQTLAETDARAQEMGLFVYPSAGNSRWRVFPLGSIAILLAALGVSTELSAITDRRRPDGDSTGLVEWTREGSEEAVDYVDWMAVEREDLRAPVTGIISLLTCSLLHPEGDSSGSSRLASAGLLLTSGAIIERLHGPVRFLGAVTAATAVSNLVGLRLSCTDLSLLGSSPAVFFGVGYLSILRPFSMWACLPNLPIPCQWLLAPAVVSLATRAWRLLGSSRSMETVDEDATAPRPYEQLSNRDLRRLMSRTAVQLSMLETAQEGEVDEGRSIGVLYATTGTSRSEVNASLASLHDQLEALRQEWSARGGWPSDRYAGLISDFTALLLGLGWAYLTRGRFRTRFPAT